MSNLYFNTDQSALLNDAVLVTKKLAPVEPSYTTQLTADYRVNSIKFGNGYEQVGDDGINCEQLSFEVAFLNMSSDAINAVAAFLRGKSHNGVNYDRKPSEYFYWQPPAPYDTDGVIKVRCTNIKVTPISTKVMSLTAQFNQTFEL